MNLTREREAFVRQFLRRGVEITEGLLEENREIREQLNRLEKENANLRAQVASDDAIRGLLTKIEEMEGERQRLLRRSDQLEEDTRSTAHRNAEVEQELHDLANLYVASSYLHATYSPRAVVRHLRELLQQLVGADQYVIYFLDPERDVAVPVASDGVDPRELSDVQSGSGMIGEAMLTGVPRISERIGETNPEKPIAVIPLSVRKEVVGVIAVLKLLRQKEVWAPVDHELFKFLSFHAGTALVNAIHYANSDGPKSALTGLSEQLSPNT